MKITEPEFIRTWLFGPGMPGAAQMAMGSSGSDAVIVDLEDSTPSELRPQARDGLQALLAPWRDAGIITSVRINALESHGHSDLAAAMKAGAQVIVYPMAETADQIRALDAAITDWEAKLNLQTGMMKKETIPGIRLLPEKFFNSADKLFHFLK